MIVTRTTSVPALYLLEDRAGDSGLDAIIIHTAAPRRWWERLFHLKPYSDKSYLVPPSAARKLARYYTASCLFPLCSDARKAEVRENLGHQFNLAWKQGLRPQLRLIYEQMPALKKRHLRSVA